MAIWNKMNAQSYIYAAAIGFPGMGDPGDTGRNRNLLH